MLRPLVTVLIVVSALAFAGMGRHLVLTDLDESVHLLGHELHLRLAAEIVRDVPETLPEGRSAIVPDSLEVR